MKKIILTMIFLIILQACQVILPTKVETLKIVLSPSISEETFLNYKNEFLSAFKTELLNNGYDVNEISIQLATSNIQATEMIITKVADIGFLTKLSFFENRESNLEVLLTQTELSYDLPIEDISVWNDKTQLDSSLKLLDHHYAGIYAGSSIKGEEIYNKFKSGQLLTWIDLNSVKWCHVLVTSQEGYIYPSLWLIDNYSRRISELFDHELVVKGYPELMLKLANQECDIVVGPDTLRKDYESLWQKSEDQGGFGRLSSIYNEVRLIALSQEILHDPIVYSSLNESLDEGFINAIKKSMINMVDAEIKNPLLEAMDINGLIESSKLEYESFLPAYEYLNSIFN
jgi:phosphonate transport system substrate-binding protein